MLAYKNTTSKGFTLIELLLYISLVGVLLISITAFFGLSAEARIKNQTIMEVNQQGMAAMDYITQTIRNGSAVTTPALGVTSGSLTLSVPTASLSPTVISLNGTTLQTVEGSSSAIHLTSNRVQISGLSFKNLARPGTPANIQVSFVVTRTNSSNKNEYDYSKTFTTSAEVQW